MNHVISRGVPTSKYRWWILLLSACGNTLLWDAPACAKFGDLLFTFTDANSSGDDDFGYSVALSQTTAVVGNGSPFIEDPPGPRKVHVFDLSTGAQRYELVHSEVTATEVFGFSAAIDGNILFAGAGGINYTGKGEAYLFDASTGQKIRQLSGATQVPKDTFGGPVAIDGDKAIVGAVGPFPFVPSSGAAYVFDVTSGQELFKFRASDVAASGDQFSHAVDISGNIAIVGAPSEHADANNAGAAYLYDLTTGQRLRKLRASDASTNDNFGWSVAIEGNVAIIGAKHGSSASGYAYVFNVATGQQLFKLVPSDSVNGDYFGYSVAISGNTAIVGAIGNGAGAAYLFDVTTGQELLKFPAPEGVPPYDFGWSVAIDGNRAIVGTPGKVFFPGAAFVFDVTRIPGDFNTDGAVDAADYIVWRNGLGTTYTQTDYDVWRANFGQTAAGAAAINNIAKIPEPASVVLLTFCILSLFASRYRK